MIDVTAPGSYLNRMLDYHDPQAIKRKYPGLPFDDGTTVPVLENLPIGHPEITQEILDGVGETVEFTNDLLDVPFVEVSVDEDRYLVSNRVIGVKFSIMDLKRQQIAASNGQIYTDIVKERNDKAMRVMAEYGNKSCAYGAPERGVSGVLNNPNVTKVNSTFDPYDPATTDDDIVDWVTEQITALESGKNMTSNPNVIVVSKKLHKRICSIKPLANWSVKQSILTTNEGIALIRPINEVRFDQLEEFGIEPSGTNKSLMWIYTLNNEDLKRMTSTVDRYPVEYHYGSYISLWVKSFAAPQIMNPNSMLYVSYPEDSIV